MIKLRHLPLDKTMDYMAKHYRYGDDLVKKLAKAII